MSLAEQMARDEAEAERLGISVMRLLNYQLEAALETLKRIADQPDLWTEAARREAPVPAHKETE